MKNITQIKNQITPPICWLYKDLMNIDKQESVTFFISDVPITVLRGGKFKSKLYQCHPENSKQFLLHACRSHEVSCKKRSM